MHNFILSKKARYAGELLNKLYQMRSNEKIRILYLITDMGKGGAERYLIDLCNELQKSNEFEFVIGVLYDNNMYKTTTTHFNIRFLNYNTFSLSGKNACPEYQQLLRDFKPHIVHTHRFLAEFLSSYYADPKVAYICHGHDNMVQFQNFTMKTFFNRSRLLSWIEKKYLYFRKYRKVKTWFIANSSDTKSYLQSVLTGGSLQRLRLMYCGFNYPGFYINKQREIQPGKLIKILNVGSFQRKKNQILFVEIAKELKSRGVHFEINLLGSGEFFDLVKGRIEEENLNEYIKLFGQTENIVEHYHVSDIYVHTAYYEPFGLVLLEAMAAGLPVIALDGMGNRDVIQNGDNGYLIENDDPVLFADVIEKIITDTDIYQAISQRGKEFASQFDSSLKNKEMLRFYKEILESF